MFEMYFNLKPQPWKANTSLALSIASYQIPFSTVFYHIFKHRDENQSTTRSRVFLMKFEVFGQTRDLVFDISSQSS